MLRRSWEKSEVEKPAKGFSFADQRNAKEVVVQILPDKRWEGPMQEQFDCSSRKKKKEKKKNNLRQRKERKPLGRSSTPEGASQWKRSGKTRVRFEVRSRGTHEGTRPRKKQSPLQKMHVPWKKFNNQGEGFKKGGKGGEKGPFGGERGKPPVNQEERPKKYGEKCNASKKRIQNNTGNEMKPHRGKRYLRWLGTESRPGQRAVSPVEKKKTSKRTEDKMQWGKHAYPATLNGRYSSPIITKIKPSPGRTSIPDKLLQEELKTRLVGNQPWTEFVSKKNVGKGGVV